MSTSGQISNCGKHITLTFSMKEVSWEAAY